MSPPYWIHCNVCAVQFSKNLKIYMTSCQHILCRDCIKNFTEKGTKCPLCKKNIKKFEELAKLPEDARTFFRPEVAKSIKKSVMIIKFQCAQQKNLFKLSHSYQSKCKRLLQEKAKLQKEAEMAKAEYMKAVEIRKQMQEKLKQRYMMARSGKGYRDPAYDTLSSVSHSSSKAQSIQSTPRSFHFNHSKSSTSMTSSGSKSGFFDKNAPMLQSQRSLIASMSQSKRKPFFA